MTETLVKKSIKRSKGAGLIELSIVLPILLILIFGAIELARSLRIYSSMNIVARGLASSAFRDCANKTLSGNLQNCLDSVINSTSNTAKDFLPNSTLIVSLYKWDPTKTFPNEPTRAGISPVPASPPNGTPVSRFSASSFSYANSVERNTLLKDNGIIVYSEVFFPYNTVVPSLPGIFGFSNNLFYVTATF
jgi:hypothetical protein